MLPDLLPRGADGGVSGARPCSPFGRVPGRRPTAAVARCLILSPTGSGALASVAQLAQRVCQNLRGVVL